MDGSALNMITTVPWPKSYGGEETIEMIDEEIELGAPLVHET